MTRRMRMLRSAGVAFCLAVGCASSSPSERALGSIDNPVRADSFLGELEYLSRLRCPDGSRPHAQRLVPRSRREGPYGHRLLGYRVRCIYLNTETTVYIDEFHRSFVELEPVAGFTMARPPDRRQLFWFDP